MASFTDNIQALSTFNPYIEQQPIEAMVQVGMQKQQQYNEGYQKIQSSIDKVAGLDIIRDVDKNYLQSKLNSLGNKLKTVAAGDFSSFQLTNSVAGMASKVAQDNNIINAVTSTNKVRKELSRAELAKKEGKSSVQNQEDLNEQINNYLNNEEIGASFNGEYTPYINMDEKLRKLAKDIHESDTSYDNPFVRDASGNTLYFDKKGNASLDPTKGEPMKDAAMLTVGSKSKSAEKILNTFYTTLTPDDLKQLQIDGKYHYKGATKQTFQNSLITNFNKTKKIISDGIIEKALEIQTSDKLTPTQKASQQAKLNESLALLNDGHLEKELLNQLKEIENIKDLNSYKAQLYTKTFLTNLASDLAYDDKKFELKSNPYEQAEDRRLMRQLAYNKEAREAAQWQATFNQNERHWQADYMLKTLTATEKKKKDLLVTTDVGSLDTNVNSESLIKLEGEINALVGKRNEKGEIVFEGQLQKLDQGAFSFIPGGKNMNLQEKTEYLTKLASKYNKDPGSIKDLSLNPQLRKYLESRRELELVAGTKQKLYSKTQALTKDLTKQADDILIKQGGIVDKNGRQIYSAKELMEVNGALKQYYIVSKAYGGDRGTYTFDSVNALAAFKGSKYEPIVKAIAKKDLPGSNNKLTYSEQLIVNQIRKIKGIIDPQIKDIVAKKTKIENDYLNKYSPNVQTTIGTFNTMNKDTKARIYNTLGNLLEKQFKQGSLDTRNVDDATRTLITKLKSEPHTTYTIIRKNDGSAELVLSGKDGERVPIPMTTDEVINHFPEVAVTNSLADAKAAINASEDHSTNLSGDGNPIDSRYTGYSLPQLRDTKLASRVRYDIEGDPNNTGGEDDGYVVKLYVQPYGSNVWVPGYLNQYYVSLAGIQTTLDNIGNTTIDSFLTMNKK